MLGRILFGSVVVVLAFGARGHWFESCPDHIFLPCIYSYVSLLQTLFVRIHISIFCILKVYLGPNKDAVTNFISYGAEKLCFIVLLGTKHEGIYTFHYSPIQIKIYYPYFYSLVQILKLKFDIANKHVCFSLL